MKTNTAGIIVLGPDSQTMY